MSLLDGFGVLHRYGFRLVLWLCHLLCGIYFSVDKVMKKEKEQKKRVRRTEGELVDFFSKMKNWQAARQVRKAFIR